MVGFALRKLSTFINVVDGGSEALHIDFEILPRSKRIISCSVLTNRSSSPAAYISEA